MLEELQLNYAVNRDEFIADVERIVAKDDITYIEAIMIVCAMKELDPEEMIPVIKESKAFMQKLSTDALRYNQLNASKIHPNTSFDLTELL